MNKKSILLCALCALCGQSLRADPPPTTQPPGGGGADSTYILFIDAHGNDSTATVGDPTHPWADWQTAYGSGATYSAAHGNCKVLLKGGIISGTGINLAADWNSNVALAGMGPSLTSVGGINASGTNGSNGADGSAGVPGGNGANGGNAFNINLTSDLSVDVGNILADGGAGGNGGNNTDDTGTGGNGGNAGNPGAITLNGVYSSGAISESQQNFGNAGYDTGGYTFTSGYGGGVGGPTGGSNSTGGWLILTNVVCTGAVNGNGGNGGTDQFGGGAASSSGVSISISNSVVNTISASSGNDNYGGGAAGYIALDRTRFNSVTAAGSIPTLIDYCADGTAAVSNPFTGFGTSSSGAATTNSIQP